MDTQNTLGQHFSEYIQNVQDAWGEPTEALALHVESAMRRLFAESPESEPWIAELLAEKPPKRKLYEDPERGFIQMGHYHQAGHASPPHNHGVAWVVYGVYRGELEIATYQQTGETDAGRLTALERRRLTDGVAYAYMPGAIHSTRCLSPGAVVLRFLSRDLNQIPRSHFGWDQIIPTNG